MAKLKFYYGSMNCGKSTLLLQRIHNRESRNMKIALFKPSIDTKGERSVVSRLGISREVDELLLPSISLYRLVKDEYLDCSTIFIDEAQFMEPDQVEDALKVSSILDIPIECYGLRTDFLTNSFPGSKRLLEIADEINEIETRCECGRKATLVARYKDGIMVLDGDQVAIDNNNSIKYISYCPKCYFEESEKYKIKKY